MWVREAFMGLNANLHDVESISLNGWEHLIFMRGLGFESYVCQLCVI